MRLQHQRIQTQPRIHHKQPVDPLLSLCACAITQVMNLSNEKTMFDSPKSLTETCQNYMHQYNKDSQCNKVPFLDVNIISTCIGLWLPQSWVWRLNLVALYQACHRVFPDISCWCDDNLRIICLQTQYFACICSQLHLVFFSEAVTLLARMCRALRCRCSATADDRLTSPRGILLCGPTGCGQTSLCRLAAYMQVRY